MEPHNLSFLECRLFFTCVVLLLCVILVSSGNNVTDKLALLAFKAAITEDPFGALNSWNHTADHCQWYGVTCGRLHHRVTGLDLQALELSGSISEHIGNLSFLRVLILNNNSFHHAIPQQVGHLHSLRVLRLALNTLEGEIPRNLSGCTRLTWLSLGANSLVGEIPIDLGSLLQLQNISLFLNYLTGTVPSFIGNMSSLENLILSANELGGKIPQALGKLTKLNRLVLDENRLSGAVPPSIFNLSSVTMFDIGVNQIGGNLPANLGFTLPNIEHFSIFSNRFTGGIPRSMSNATALGVLQASQNKLSGNMPPLDRLNKLKRLSMNFNHLGSGGYDDFSFFCSLTNTTTLLDLSIYENSFGGTLPECIGNFSVTLLELWLGENLLFGTIPRTVGNLVNLERLLLDHNRFSGTVPSVLGDLHNLVVLDLSNKKFSGAIPSSLGSLVNLAQLRLDHNNFHGYIPSRLSECQRLVLLDLSSNNLNGSIPPEFIGLPSLSILLNLSRNHLTGVLPEEVGKLNLLAQLDVSGNMLDGDIPASLGSCVGLELLKMQENSFQGSIPSSIGMLRNVNELDLSHNNLSGQIPEFFEALHLLKILNLSYNNFEGTLPTKGIFNNVSATFVSGNDKLCAGMPEFHLPKCSYRNSGRRIIPKWKLVITIFFGVLVVALVLALVYFRWLKNKKRAEPASNSKDDSSFNLSYGILLKATNGFSSINLIGVGGFGSVYKGVLDENGTVIAAKVLNLTLHGAVKSFITECEALRNVRHRNLLKVLTVCSGTDYRGNEFKALVYEFMVNGSLEDWLHPSPSSANADGNVQKLSLIQRINISIDVASALDYLHNQLQSPIIHCDLKPSNVLLDAEMVGHVGDFGLAKVVIESTDDTKAKMSSAGVRGTVGYAAPEYGMESMVSREGDAYSYGILLLEMFTGVSPTNEMFRENFNLHKFVKEALPERLLEITDPFLLQEMESHMGTSRGDAARECLEMVYRIGVGCSVEARRERANITEAAAQLHFIRDKLHAAGLQG
ncbi:probable LRR receptor-like serine/threonine-protein kinase At3g47570 [Rhodamnia argentea]|uniref:Probable LRR receptor-like serine/threonine-protein kinase At3g47570 n=1 Tax=Rhodamnia argentea TaxID=178133 RepID=A0A8B8QNU2_9MYRT|nr:probable LRR receptor-like serine/threonine-protein kinase At3g47570 [Rhodamnia argentea]